MLRRALLYLSEQSSLCAIGWRTPPFSRSFTSRFVAGRTLDEGIQVLQDLWRQHILGTLDFLGENVKSLEEAAHSSDAIWQRYSPSRCEIYPPLFLLNSRSSASIFPKHACLNNVMSLVERARNMASRVEIDMESSEYTDRTLDFLTRLQDAFPGSVRAVIQAYLFRSEDDIRHAIQPPDPGSPVQRGLPRTAAVAFRPQRRCGCELRQIDEAAARTKEPIRLSQATMRALSARRYDI